MASFFGFARGQFANEPAAQMPAFPDAVDRDSAPRHSPSGRSARDLVALVEAEIIPRMVATGPARAIATMAPQDATISTSDVDHFIALTLSAEAAALMAYVDQLVARGISEQTVLIDVLAPTARALGVMWENDECDFLDVTMGVWRLQEIVVELAGRRVPPHGGHGPARRILLTTMPGDQHGFALVLIEHLFALEGWEVDRLTGESASDIVGMAAQHRYDVVGLTVSSDSHNGALPSLIRSLRSVSRNPRLCILIGGLAVLNDTTLSLRVGADAAAADGRDAVKLAAAWVSEGRIIASAG